MARRYDSKEAKRRILTACVRLFLEKGYTNTKVAEILKEADVSAGSFQNIFRTKDGVLTELIGMMFSRQFGAVRPLAANAPSPVYLYAVETALQLAMTELSENLRDIYVEAYTFPATAEIIHRSTTTELQAAFSAYLPGCAECDFYEMELGSFGSAQMATPLRSSRASGHFSFSISDLLLQSRIPMRCFKFLKTVKLPKIRP